jgi:hypothetical protein
MLKFLAVISFLILGLIAVDVVSSVYLPCKQASEQQKKHEGAKEGCGFASSASYRWTVASVDWIDARHDFVTAASTVVIAVFTIILGIFTVSVANATRVAANAADLSARAAIAMQLPIIRIRLQPLTYAKNLQGPIETENCCVDYVDVRNLGAMKASPKEILYGWTVGEALPPKPTYTSANKFPHNSILEPDSANHVRTLLTGVHLLRDGEWSKISRGNYLWFYCEIIYEDFMGERHSHGFCWLWGYDGEGMNWRTSNAAAYNQKT